MPFNVEASITTVTAIRKDLDPLHSQSPQDQTRYGIAARIKDAIRDTETNCHSTYSPGERHEYCERLSKAVIELQEASDPHDQSIDIPFSIWPGSAAPKNVSFSMLKEPGGFCDLLAPWKDIPDVLVHNDGEPRYAGTLVELLNDSDHALRDLSIYVRNSRLEEREDIQMALKNIIDAGEAAKRLNNNFKSRLAPLIPHLPPKSKRLIRQLASNPPPGLHDRLFSHILDPLFLLRNDPLKLFLVPKPSNLTAWEIPKLVSVMHELNTTLTTMQTEHRRIEDVLVLLGMSMEPGRNVYVRGVLARFWMRLATETDCRNRHFRTHVKLLSGYEVHLRWAVKAAGDALRVVREVEASLGQQERKGKSCSVLEEARRISCMKGAEIHDEVGRAVGESWVFGETL
ncbi:hypothetical protein SLS55_010362 [Diplodia seriata]|uniref:Uncharacterized protein n=1 Tax=Diplodia seriata TaxID=420778 RepID=A0ABR3BYB7_9PEZI